MEIKTESRKKDHVDLVLREGAQYNKTNGLEKFEYMHNALPEIDFDSIDLSTRFFNKKIDWPIMIIGMTGGYNDAERINKELAKVAQKYNIPMGLGSQRAMIEKPDLAKTYKIREVAKTIPVVGNIGAAQLKKYKIEQIQKLVDSIGADAFAVHLNALQEVIQPEGDLDFSGVLGKIEELCKKLTVPVIVKETGAGISQEVAISLKEVGVKMIDVSGSGGTSWSKVEYLRGGKIPGFENWGISTADAIVECRGVLPLIASGGIKTGIEGAKTITLGADICGAAYPFILALDQGKLDEKMKEFTMQMKTCAFLTGSENLEQLRKAKMKFC
jgi:isopentenyl-diphosphate delta-isomerase